MLKKRLSKLMFMVFAFVFLLLVCGVKDSHAASVMKAYTISAGNTTVYRDKNFTSKYGTIYSTDELKILEINNNYLKVTYPTASQPKTGYIPRSAVLLATRGYKRNVTRRITTYRRNSTTRTYGYIDSGDNIIELGTKGSFIQVCYPVSGGNKIGWIRSSDATWKSISNPRTISDGYYMIQSGNSSNRVLDINNWNLNNGGNLEIYQKNRTTNQIFKVTYVGNGYYKIMAYHSGRYLDVNGASTASGTNVQQYTWNGSAAQLWKFSSAGNGYYFIRSKCGTYLDNSGGNTRNGNNVWAYSYNGSNAQKWKFVSVSAPSPSTCYVNTNAGLSLRADTSTSSARKTTIPYRAAVSVYANNGTWSYVSYNGTTGYVASQYLSKTKPYTNGNPDNNTTSFQYPLSGAKCTWRGYTNMSWGNNRYGSGHTNERVYHLGIDIIGSNDNVMAAAAGTVKASGWNSANGNYVVIQHTLSGKTVYSFYAHLQSRLVSAGKSVSKGEKIGIVGNTGSASQGKHLHFAITDTYWQGSYYGYATSFSGDKVRYAGVTYYNPVYVIRYGRLP